jgi:hypothetical protein
MSKLDQLLDLASDHCARGQQGRWVTVTLDSMLPWYEYHQTALGETREQAAATLLDCAFRVTA